MFEWDEVKRRRVLEQRGLDFFDGGTLFDGRPLITAPARSESEERWLSIGEIDGRVIAIVWTWRGDAIRIITMRRARDEEAKRYRALLGS
jgi:hypothetical protein